MLLNRQWVTEEIKKYMETKEKENTTIQSLWDRRRPSRWWRSKTWRSPSSQEIHHKYIYMWNNSYRTRTECWQKTSDFPKGKKFPTYRGRAKEKTKTKE